MHQLPIGLLPASRPLIQGRFDHRLLDIARLAAMGTVAGLMSHDSAIAKSHPPQRLSAMQGTETVERDQWLPGRLLDLCCGMWDMGCWDVGGGIWDVGPLPSLAIPCHRMHREAITDNDLEILLEMAIPLLGNLKQRVDYCANTPHCNRDDVLPSPRRFAMGINGDQWAIKTRVFLSCAAVRYRGKVVGVR
jgi:hypothetical protein